MSPLPFESEKVPIKNPSDGCTCPLSRSQFILGGGLPLATHFSDIASPGCSVSSAKVSSNSGDTAAIKIICKIKLTSINQKSVHKELREINK